MMNEKQLSASLYKYIKEGAQLRKDGGICKHAGNTVAHMLSTQGWLTEDLRQALIKADPDGYGKHHKV